MLLPVIDAALRHVLPRRDHEYEDLRQSALETVFGAMRKDEFRGESSISTWAYRITRNVAVDALRARSRERRVFSRTDDVANVVAHSHSARPNPEKLADVRQQLAHYREALRGLSPAKAQVVYLYDVLGHDLDRIAGTLGITVAAAQSRLIRGRKEIGEVIATLERNEVEWASEPAAPRSGARWRAVGRKEGTSKAAGPSTRGGRRRLPRRTAGASRR